MRSFRSAAVAVAGILLVLPTAAGAQQAEPSSVVEVPVVRGGPSFAGVVDFALEVGGDRVMEAFFEDGSSQTMRAGQGGTLSLGGEIRPHVTSPLALRATVGFKYVTTAADNANIMLTRVPLELVGTYMLPNGIRLGGGLVRHTRVHFNGDGFIEDADFEDATGPTAEVGWKWVALTYTRLDYADQFGNEYNGSSAGLSLIGTFPLR